MSSLCKRMKISLNYKFYQFYFLHFKVDLSETPVLQHCQIKNEKNASDADGSDSPESFTAPSLPWLSVFLNSSELLGKLKCQSQILALPAVYTNPHSAFRGLGTCYVQNVWLDSGVQNLYRLGSDQCCAQLELQYTFQKSPDPLLMGLRMVFTFYKTHSFPHLVAALPFVLSFTHLTSSPTFFSPVKRKKLM